MYSLVQRSCRSCCYGRPPTLTGRKLCIRGAESEPLGLEVYPRRHCAQYRGCDTVSVAVREIPLAQLIKITRWLAQLAPRKIYQVGQAGD